MKSIVAVCLVLMLPLAYAQDTSPGETSGAPLAPLVVAAYDKASGNMRLAYQTGCGTVDNNIYYGPLSEVSSLGFSGSVCGIGTTGSYSGFNPGPGSYFFLVVGNDAVHEGSYGQAMQGGTSVERFPYLGNACGEIQQLADACTPAPQGGACSDSGDCGPRQTCVENAAGAGECVCLDPFTGAYCDVCAPGYTGVDCRECARGYSSNVMELASGSDGSEDLTDPSRFRCELDVTGSCAGVTCSGSGVCEVIGQDGYCACDPGYTGSDCSECAPDYELDAAGACVLGELCRDAKCGGHGACVPTGFGDVTCACDAGYSGTDCGGAALAIHTSSETLSLYGGQTIVLDPVGGTGPFTWQIVEGPAHVTPCGIRDPGCPQGSARLTVDAPAGGIQDLTLVKVLLYQPGGGQALGNYVALPLTMVPFTGTIHEELMPYYRAMLKYMRARGIRAGTLGISRGGVLVGVNGYGYRDSGLDDDPWVNAGEGGPLVQPNSPFRVGSLSKVLTAAAVRGAAADQGVDITSNGLESRAATWIEQSIGFDPASDVPPFDYNLLSPNSADPRWEDVTIEQLLNHHAGYYRDGASVADSTNGMPKYNGDKLPFTQDLNDPNELQTVDSGTDSDISAALVYALAALQAGDDPRPTVDKMIRFSAGISFHYNPGGLVSFGPNYSNLGYIMLSRILEGLKGRAYDPDEPGVPMGWGAYPELLQDYLCESSGIVNGVVPGDAFNQHPLEPYYRGLSWDGVERLDWNLAEGADKIRFDDATQRWQFCQSGCPNEPGAVWNLEPNAPRAYGGVWLAERNGAGGLAVNAEALLKFARNHRVKVGTPGNNSTNGIGIPLPGPGSYPAPSSSHAGQSAGARAWLIQWGGDQVTNQLPTDTGSWNANPAAPLDLDDDGKVVVAENLAGSPCLMPNNVALAVAFNQDADQRAPWENVSAQSSSTNGAVYGRIMDFLGDATCQVAAAGWPALGDLPAQPPQVCN